MPELTPQQIETLGAILQKALDRLAKAGWAASRCITNGKLDVVWTPHGVSRAMKLNTLLKELGPDIDAAELEAIIHLFRYMSPGGAESLSQEAE